MSTQKHLQLIDKLIAKTQAGQLNWKESVSQDEFEVSFPNYTIRIWESGSDIYVGIINSDGQIIDHVSDRDLREIGGTNYYFLMKEMYNKARRIALGADKALDSLLDELD